MGDRKEYTRARDLYAQHQYQQAVNELTGYIYKTDNVKRREARAYRLLGMSYEQLGQFHKALEVYAEALEFHPRNVPLLVAAAGLYQRSGLTDKSQELYDRALAEEPDNLEALAGQAENYRSFGFFSKARAYYDHFFALNPAAEPVYRARYATTFLNQHNYEQAYIHITMALMQDPSVANYWLLSAKAAYGLGRTQEAQANLQTALSLEPQRMDLQLYQIIGLYQAGQYAQALQKLKPFLATNPDSALGVLLQA